MVPVELSVNKTVSGALPNVGLPVKSAVGETAPAPITELVELPALDVKTTTLEKLEAVAGLNATVTTPVWPAVRLYGLPAPMLKGAAVAALPLRVCPPVLTTWKTAVLVWPTITVPKSREVGLTNNLGCTAELPNTVKEDCPPT